MTDALPVRLDATWMLAPNVGPEGVDPEALAALRPEVEAAVRRLVAQHEAGTLAFLDLPQRTEVARQVCAVAEAVGRDRTDVLWIGIGGSALGPRAIATVVQACGEAQRRLHVLDNPDPCTTRRLLAALDPRHTVVCVVSKSGATVETIALYHVARQWLTDAVGDAGARQRLVVVTDPARGPLRRLAASEGLAALDVPPNVGGRFSVLTPVGLLAAALVGGDVDALLAGARAMVRHCIDDPGGAASQAATAAALHVLADRAGRSICVTMAYADALLPVADWFVQLWGESLGKRRPDGQSVGPTPVRAVGAVDQHSQLQLFVQGPPVRHVWFLVPERFPRTCPVPQGGPSLEGLSHLPGHDLGALLRIEHEATSLALAEAGRPHATVWLQDLDLRSLGALFVVFEVQVAIAAELYGVCAYDQPGVEAGKQFAHALLGRPGSEAVRERIAALRARARRPLG